ncbi:pentatricopeptide repeat-containing protein At4g21065 [Elaeis guineensis]|uniref:Pentatricopeptide repeat-containing protein At4g21065 n=1 Tax=Elaeis guineensis var. tenera TaxID=51953 RepID=A0A6I9RF62_ELAGV|nr:pentatricopeptide repeat-containing protein At4g21065 [Elaeis guineensis]
MAFPSARRFKSLPPLTSTAGRGQADERSCLALLQGCESLPKLLQAQAFLLKSGLQANPLVLAKFTSTASSLDAVDAATSLLFHPRATTHLYDDVLFNTVIRSHANAHRPESKQEAIFYYSLMLRGNLHPNKFTFPFLLKACAGLPSAHGIGSQVHASAVKFGFADDSYVQNTLIHMYSSSTTGLDCARKVFDRNPKSSPVTWSAMIAGYVRSGLSNEAVTLFREMQVSRVRADDVVIITVLSACADLGALELARWLGSYVERERIPKSLSLCNALVDALAKCGDIDGAVAFFKRMPERSIVSWTSVIDGLAMHSRGSEAVCVFEAMKDAGVPPDDVTFISVLTACSHAGMVDEGCRYFDSMRSEFGLQPKIEHYGCMVDLFSRAGMVERAVEFVRTMPIEPNPVIWRTLVSACRIHGRLELGESINKQLLDKDPMNSSSYVMLSNVYALTRRWDKKWEIRKAMSKHGIRKVPGCSSVELDGEIYEFIAGDTSHLQYKEIYEMVEEIGRKLKKAGYVPISSEVLLDIDEGDKEDALHWHSEKLAIAFMMLKTPPKTPIRIVKNLRVCADCHLATKFISKVYDREIIVRDRNRFHCFKDGFCSCKDFW